MKNAFVAWRYVYEKQSTDDIRLIEVIFLFDTADHVYSVHDKLTATPSI